MSRTVVFYDQGMIYREIGGVLIKVAHRVASALHDILDQRIGMIHGSLRVIHK